MIRAPRRRDAKRRHGTATEEQKERERRETGGNCRMESDEAAVCGNNRVYFSQTAVSKGSHGRRENETKV